MSRPSKYETEVKDQLTLVKGWARDGLTNEQIAHNLGISVKTLYEWQNAHSEFREALKKGKEVIDYEVENALLKKALEGDTTAQIFWLKNRRSTVWRDKQEISAEVKSEVKASNEVQIKLAEDEEGRELLKQLYRLNRTVEGSS